MSCKESYIQYPEGGHDFPRTISNNDTNNYFYPYKDSGTTKDAFIYAEEYRFYKAMGEENLSISPYKEAIFRFTYGGWMEHPLIITLTSNQITVKWGSKSMYAEEDTSRLSPTEQMQYNLLSRFFPLNDTSYSKRRKHYLDSLVQVYPQLLSPAYYHSLINKVIVPTTPPFTYTTTKVPISTTTFRHLVTQFNNAGYWDMPYHFMPDIYGPPTDGYGFSLEANTGRKYKCVHIIGCPGDTTRITKACQELVKYAKVDDQIQLIWEGTTEMIPADSVLTVDTNETRNN